MGTNEPPTEPPSSPSAAQPGWYPANVAGQERYWNGSQWTDAYRPTQNQQTAVEPKKKTSKLVIALAIFGGIILLAAIGSALGDGSGTPGGTASSPAGVAPPVGESSPAAPEGPQEEVMVQRFEGSGKHTTRPFTVSNKWEIRWVSQGGYLGITLHDESGNFEGVPANTTDAGPGSAFQPTGGTYYLDINATEGWTVEVWDLP